MASAIIIAFWLLGFSAVALAVGPEKIEKQVSSVALSAVSATDALKIDAQYESPRRLSGLEMIRFSKSTLTPQALSGISPALAIQRAADWVKAVDAEGGKPIEALGEILPSSTWVQARLVTRRDEVHVAEDAESGGEYGTTYSELQAALPETRNSSKAVEAAIDEIWRVSGISARLKPGPVAVLKSGDRWIPGKSALSASHQYALDVFFTSLKRHGVEEKGPMIRSMVSGIVVSASNDWSGGDKPSLYRSGGLSPKAGNGAVIYNPDEQRYYAYFHLSSVDVRVGQVVEAGQSLGRGGNTGVNARKKGHGGHVHVEIHDVDGGPWTSYRIRDFILSMR